MSIGNLYEITRRSFRALDAAMNVAGQNIANADSAGFARRRLLTRADSYGTLGFNARIPRSSPTGSGVSLHSYVRLRDDLLATSAFRANGNMESASERHRIMASLEGVVSPSEGGLTDRLQDFWNAWSDVSDNPTDSGVRTTLLTRAQGLADTLNQADRRINEMEDGLRAEVADSVAQVNQLLARVAELNAIVTASTNNGTPDFAAADERDVVVRQLSALTGIEVQANHRDGLYIAIGGVFVVQGEHAESLTLDSNTLEITFGNSSTRYRPETGGKLGASISTLSNDIPQIRERLDRIAETLVIEVNAIHETGFGLDDATGLNFFDPTGTSASSIRISADVAGSPDSVATAGAAGSPGDSEIARRIADLRIATLVGTRTLGDEAIDVVGSIGAEVNRAALDARAEASVLNHLDAMEAGVSAVSVEDEMTHIIELQQAYAATARVLRATETMIDTLLAI